MADEAGAAAIGRQKPVSVLFVCLGNICRSPMAEGVFQHITRPADAAAHPLIARIDSCGTGGWHLGCPPDPRTMSTLKDHGIATYSHQARKFDAVDDLTAFDYVFAMDDDNLGDLVQARREVMQCRAEGEQGMAKVMLFGEARFGGQTRRNGKGEEVQDPYYGGQDGFETAYEQAVRFGRGFVAWLERGEDV